MDQLSAMFTRLKRGMTGEADSSHPGGKRLSQPTNHNEDDDNFEFLDAAEVNPQLSLPNPYTCSESYQGSSQNADHLRNAGDTQAFPGGTNKSPIVQPLTDLPDTQPHHNDQQHVSAIAGVPFQLHPTFMAKSRLVSMLGQLDVTEEKFDWEKFGYNFECEQTALRDLQAIEDSREGGALWRR